MYLQWQAYLERCQTSKMETFAKIVNGLKLLIVFAKNSILNVRQDSEYAYLSQAQILLFNKKQNFL